MGVWLEGTQVGWVLMVLSEQKKIKNQPIRGNRNASSWEINIKTADFGQ